MINLKKNLTNRWMRILAAGIFLSLFYAANLWADLPAQDRTLFEKANKLYYSEKYADAQKIYDDLFKRYPDYGVLAYNLGNAYYRLGKTGPAILAYEKALLREPRDRDIARNLKQVRAGLQYRIEDKRNWYLRAAEISIQKLTENEVSLLLALAYFFFVGSMMAPLFLGRGLRFGLLQKIFAISLFVLLMLYAAKRVEVRVIRDAIVMAKKADVRFGPSEGDRIAFRLGEGLKVFVVHRREGWSRIILTNGEDGWIKNSSIEEV